MKCPRLFAWVATVVLLTSALNFAPTRVYADDTALVFREIKITGDEFVVLQNIGSIDIPHLSDYWLGYSGSDNATAPPVQELPDYDLESGAVIMLSGGGVIDTCDAAVIADLSPSLSDSKGSLVLWHQTSSGFTPLPQAQAQAKWNKSSSTTNLPLGEIDLKNETTQYPYPVWYFDSSAGWQLGNLTSCTLTTYSSPSDTLGSTAAIWPHYDTNPPAIIESVGGDSEVVSGIPSTDRGLSAPIITEILPNPAGTGTDSTDEFIELYNPNSSSFDLSGFVLETGLTTKHKYTFAAGITLPAKSFTAFYSADTGLTLSNTTSQAFLLDPLDNIVDQSEVYSSAKDGQAWALANGSWYWTSSPSPGAANIVNQSQTTKAARTSNSGSSVKGSSTSTPSSAANFSDTTTTPTPIHAWTLAGVGGAALLYAGYEYKTDLANNLYRIRRYIASRRAAGK